MPALHTTAFELGTYRLDPVSRSVQRGAEVLPLPPKAVDVLLELAGKAGQVVGKQELMDAVWPDAFVEEANLNQMIFLLRKALVDNGVGENIVTVPRRGYRLAAEVRKVEIPCGIESIAVLPLANLSGDAAQDYFADGITEALITELAKIARLRVVSRTSIMRYKNPTESIQRIARALRVQAVVEGSVMRSGDLVRITVQLIHAAADRHLWAEKYDGAVADILVLQSRIARDVALAVGGELTRDEELRFTVSRKVHPEAHSLFLKGRYFERNLTEEGQSRAIEYYREATRIDPAYAGPYAGLAECFVELAYYFGMEPKKAFAEAEPAAIRAVKLDEELAAGHAVLGQIRLLNHWDWRGADAESRRALELAPGDAYVHWKRGVYLQYAGCSDEAIEAHRRAESLDPFSLLAIEEAGWPLYYARRYEDAEEQFRKAIELAPQWDQGHWSLGLTLVHQKRYEEAIAALRTAAQISPGNSLLGASLVYGIGRSGRIHEAEAAYQSLTTNFAYIPGWFLSIASIGMDRKDQALKCLEEAFSNREPCLVTLKVDPVFDPLRGDGRFTEMIRRTGLEP